MGVLLGTWDKVGKRLGIVETVGPRLLVGTEVGLCEGTGSVGVRLTVGDTVGGGVSMIKSAISPGQKSSKLEQQSSNFVQEESQQQRNGSPHLPHSTSPSLVPQSTSPLLKKRPPCLDNSCFRIYCWIQKERMA